MLRILIICWSSTLVSYDQSLPMYSRLPLVLSLSLLFLLTQLTFGMLFLEFVAVCITVITSMISLMLLISPLFERTFDIFICFSFFSFFHVGVRVGLLF